MPVERPTFSESWYRVKNMTPRLNSTLQTYRQHYRGQSWHVVRDEKNNQFFRLNNAAYRFIGLLDGKRNVEAVWDLCNEQLGDEAPTQNEVIQLLGQLYMSNLLQADVPPDAEALFDRYKKRIKREITGYMVGIMFMRIPLFNPERFLNHWNRVFSWIFSWPGFVLWLIWLIFGFSFLAGRQNDIIAESSGLLSPVNLPLMYAGFAILKLIHEFGHGFACKKFGKQNGSGGEVHTMGIMMMVFMPFPYVDASSAWALRSKWQRIIIAAAGMYVELAVAALAAIVWANTNAGTLIHGLAFNMMLVASVSTLLFNANPLLKYDGYYILSDLLEMPNLQQRSKDYVYYLVKRFAYFIRHPQNPALSKSEAAFFPIYCVSAFVYRIIIFSAILLMISNAFFIVGLLACVVCICMWVFVPLGKFCKYLLTEPELTRTRPWAIFISLVVISGLFTFLGTVPFPDWNRADGVIEPQEFAQIYAAEDGFVTTQLSSGQSVKAQTETLVITENRELELELQQMYSELELMRVSYRKAVADQNTSLQQLYQLSIQAQLGQIQRQQEKLARLNIKSPINGIWYSPQLEEVRGQFLKSASEQPIGMVFNPQMLIRVAAPQEIGPRIKPGMKVSFRIKGRPADVFTGTVSLVYQAGTKQLPSAALGYQMGGTFQIDPKDQNGTKTTEPFFEVLVISDGRDHLPHLLEEMMNNHDGKTTNSTLLSGQRATVRFDFGKKPLAKQWWLSLQQLMQRRFQI